MKVLSINGVSIIPDDGYGLSVRDISVEMATGEVVVIYGNSRSGKSVLLGGIAGVIPLTKGEVNCPGQELVDVSYQPEMPLLPFSMTVGSYCDRLNLVVPTAFGLKSIGKQLIGELSPSERRQLWFMSIYTRVADLYIYDEPSLGLDFSSKEECATLLRKQVQDKLVLIATSDPMFAAMVAHRVIHIAHGLVRGELLIENTPSRSSYSSRFEQIIAFAEE